MLICPRCLVLLPAVCVLWAAPELAQDEPTAEERAVVDVLFRDKITAVRRTRALDDDALLIDEMMQKADEVPDSPRVQQLIYATAVDLGRSTGAYPSAIVAAQRMRDRFPDAPEASDQALLDLMAEAYREARRDERPEVAAPYLDLLLSAGVEAEETHDVERATEVYREGAAIARAVQSPLADLFSERLERVNMAQQLEARVRQLTDAVESNPRNVNAARDLTMLMVLHRQDTVAAAAFVELTRDIDLIEVVQMSAAGPDDINAPEALRVADWYYALAETERDYTTYLLGEAMRYYDRFIAVYTRDDALLSRVAFMRQSVDTQLEELRAAAEVATRGAWTDVIPLINPRQHAIGDAPTLRGGQVYVDESGFVIPFTPDGPYDLRVRLRFERGKDGVTFHLPISDEDAALFMYSRHEHRRIHILGGEANNDEALMLKPGREVELGVQVRPLDDGKVQIVCYLNGDEIARWEDAIDELNVPDNARPSERHGNALSIRCGGRFVFRSIELRHPGD